MNLTINIYVFFTAWFLSATVYCAIHDNWIAALMNLVLFGVHGTVLLYLLYKQSQEGA